MASGIESQCRLCAREGNTDDCARTTLVFDFNLPMMLFHDGFCDRQTQTKSTGFPGARCITPIKPIEYMGQVFCVYSCATILDNHGGDLTIEGASDLDR